jgi:hypothetical protein
MFNNENGNTTIFVISLFGIFALMFVLILSFANVFIEKQHASNNAEQASIVASGVLLDSLEEAISEYDSWLILQLAKIPVDPDIEHLRPLGDQVESVKNSLPNRLTELEKRQRAVNQVLRGELGHNPFLPGFVSGELGSAEAAIREQVTNNIIANKGIVSQSKIVLNSDSDYRIEVETSTKYKSFKFDEYFSDEQRRLKQKGKGPTFEFAEAMGFSLDIEL